MRIAMIAPLEMRVPPIGYGGTELVVSLLTEELVKSGHDVTLFASGDSLTRAKLVAVCPDFLRGKQKEKSIYNMRNVVACLERAEEFDVIHNHTVLEGLSMAGLTRTPMLTTLHGDLKDDWRKLFLDYKGWYNTISHSAKRLLLDKDRFAGVIYNAIDVASYPFNSSATDDYLLFLSRMSREKGPHLAIEIARRLNRRLILAGNVDAVDEQYFREEVLPGVDNNLIRFVGEADYDMKRELMSGAFCLLAPILWDEPFGLFMVEAMACGTPVVVFNRGSAPEVVLHGVTGYVVETIEEMKEAVNKIRDIDRNLCREHVELNFDVPRMGKAYLQAYSMIQGKAISKGNEKPLETSVQHL
jgi:glycosyltransferase involved in cell wall biosynthesis